MYTICQPHSFPDAVPTDGVFLEVPGCVEFHTDDHCLAAEKPRWFIVNDDSIYLLGGKLVYVLFPDALLARKLMFRDRLSLVFLSNSGDVRYRLTVEGRRGALPSVV